jgi:prepilin-type N-terminal cleavage/methylation domain-containing protein
MMQQNQRGFSLVELSIVILVMGLLLGGLMMPLSVQRDNARVRDGHDQLKSILSAIEGFALVNGYLPCPATPASAGAAAPSGTGCTVQHGFVPATTLDLNGLRNDDNLLLDPWGSPLRYSVSSSDVNANGAWDFVTSGDMSAVSMPLLQPELTVCSTATGASATACSEINVTLTASAPVVVYSLGKDWAAFTSPDEVENVGASLGGGPSGTNYRVASDAVFVVRGKSDLGGSEFDDLLLWTAPNRLYSRLVDAGHLP